MKKPIISIGKYHLRPYTKAELDHHYARSGTWQYTIVAFIIFALSLRLGGVVARHYDITWYALLVLALAYIIFKLIQVNFDLFYKWDKNPSTPTTNTLLVNKPTFRAGNYRLRPYDKNELFAYYKKYRRHDGGFKIVLSIAVSVLLLASSRGVTILTRSPSDSLLLILLIMWAVAVLYMLKLVFDVHYKVEKVH